MIKVDVTEDDGTITVFHFEDERYEEIIEDLEALLTKEAYERIINEH